MDALEIIYNPFFWVAFLSVCISIGLYIINRKTMALLYAKPIIEIFKISISKSKPNGMGGLKPDSGCFIMANIFNPSSSGNYIRGELRKSRFSKPLENKVYRTDKPPSREYCELPSFGKITIIMHLKYENVMKYKGKKLILTIVDIRKKKIRKKFVFEDRQ
jgi:hypothetical protein